MDCFFIMFINKMIQMNLKKKDKRSYSKILMNSDNKILRIL